MQVVILPTLTPAYSPWDSSWKSTLRRPYCLHNLLSYPGALKGVVLLVPLGRDVRTVFPDSSGSKLVVHTLMLDILEPRGKHQEAGRHPASLTRTRS